MNENLSTSKIIAIPHSFEHFKNHLETTIKKIEDTSNQFRKIDKSNDTLFNQYISYQKSYRFSIMKIENFIRDFPELNKNSEIQSKMKALKNQLFKFNHLIHSPIPKNSQNEPFIMLFKALILNFIARVYFFFYSLLEKPNTTK